MAEPDLELTPIETPHTEVILHRVGIDVADMTDTIKALRFFSNSGVVYVVPLGPDGRQAIIKMLGDSPIVVPKLAGVRP